MALVPVVVLLAMLQAPAAADDVRTIYLRGWDAAREAYKLGGPPESLVPVRDAIAALDERAGGLHGPAEIARYVLAAAIAAAQSEHAELSLLIDHAVSLEAQQLDAGAPGAPGLSAHQAAGELWLMVHRYPDAEQAFERARQRFGDTPEITSGLARARRR